MTKYIRRCLAFILAAGLTISIYFYSVDNSLLHDGQSSSSQSSAVNYKETIQLKIPAAATYSGSASCKECHSSEYQLWRGSHHDLAMQEADSSTVLGNFDNISFRYAGITSRFYKKDDKYFVRTDGPDGKLHDYQIRYVFGVTPLQQYLIELPGGRLQALGIAWDSRAAEAGGQRWFHLYPDQQIRAGDALHWTSVNQNWNFQCAECHSTNLRKNYNPDSGTFNTTWSEINVSCEACHGPASNHIDWAKNRNDRSYDWADKGLLLFFDERRGVSWNPRTDGSGNAIRNTARINTKEIDACARCHARSSRLTDDFKHGKSPLNSHRLSLLEADLYWPDGQMREEVYNWGPFVQSKMYAHGVTCSDCHDPHSAKLKFLGNATCLQCHKAEKFDNVSHTHHQSGSSGSACVSCHMPATTYMVNDPRHDHSFRIPRPDLSIKLGVPNACNKCHSSETAEWAAKAISNWNNGRITEGYQNFAESFAMADRGDSQAALSLIEISADNAQPAIVRASAIQRLSSMMSQQAFDVISRALSDRDAIVRLAAIEALAGTSMSTRLKVLPALLEDPVLAVRIEAARSLSGPAIQSLEASRLSIFNRVLDEYIAVQNYNSDRPEGRANLGNLFLEKGQTESAITQYKKAIEIDRSFIPAYVNMAEAFNIEGSQSDSEKILKEGLKVEPKAAVLHHALGLALVRQGKSTEALAALSDAMKYEADNPRYAYVYAVALNDAGRHGDALKVVKSALEKNPEDQNLQQTLNFLSAKSR